MFFRLLLRGKGLSDYRLLGRHMSARLFLHASFSVLFGWKLHCWSFYTFYTFYPPQSHQLTPKTQKKKRRKLEKIVVLAIHLFLELRCGMFHFQFSCHLLVFRGLFWEDFTLGCHSFRKKKNNNPVWPISSKFHSSPQCDHAMQRNWNS